MTQSPDIAPVFPMHEQIVNEDLNCLTCGYNLRTMDINGMCPECGTAVMKTAIGNRLGTSNAKWVGKLALGMQLIIWAIVVAFAMIFVAIILSAAIANAGPGWAPVTAIILLAGFGIELLWLSGVWLVTSEEPATADAESPVSLRRLTFWAYALSFVLTLVHLLVLAAIVAMGPDAFEVLAVGMDGLSRLASTFGFICLFFYLAKLGKRIPNPWLVKRTYVVLIGMGASLGLLILIGIIGGILAVSGTGGSAFTIAVIIPGLALLIFAILSLLTLDRYRRAFNEAAKSAKANAGT